MNSFIKTLAGLAVAIIIAVVGGVGNAGQVPTASVVNTNIKPQQIRPLPGAVVKSAPVEEQESPPEVHYFSISPLALIPKDQGVTYNKTSGTLRSAIGTFYAPAHLPDGAIIASLTAYMYDSDNNGATFMEVYMYRVPHSTSSSQILNMIDSSSVMDSIVGYDEITDTTFTPAGSEPVDNEAYSYFVRTSFIASSPLPNMRLGSIVIGYTMP